MTATHTHTHVRWHAFSGLSVTGRVSAVVLSSLCVRLSAVAALRTSRRGSNPPGLCAWLAHLRPSARVALTHQHTPILGRPEGKPGPAPADVIMAGAGGRVLLASGFRSSIGSRQTWRSPPEPKPPSARVYGSVPSPVQESSRGEPSHLVPSVGAVVSRGTPTIPWSFSSVFSPRFRLTSFASAN